MWASTFIDTEVTTGSLCSTWYTEDTILELKSLIDKGFQYELQVDGLSVLATLGKKISENEYIIYNSFDF